VTARILNKESDTRSYALAVTGPETLTVGAVGQDVEDGVLTFDIAGDKQLQLRIFLTLPGKAMPHEAITLTLTDLETGESHAREIAFVRNASRR
jgi:hypothetical protein